MARTTLTPALRYLLLTGRSPEERVAGWVAVAMTPVGETERRIHNAWLEHRETLIAEAQAAGFEPYELRRRSPKGPAFDQWHRAFLERHRY